MLTLCTQGNDDGVLCITAGGDPSLSWIDLQALAAAAAQRQQQLPVPFTSLIIDAFIYSGDVTPDTWEWVRFFRLHAFMLRFFFSYLAPQGDLWAVSCSAAAAPCQL